MPKSQGGAGTRLNRKQQRQLQKMLQYCLDHLEAEGKTGARQGLRVVAEFIPRRSFGWISYATKGRWDQIAPDKADLEAVTTVYKTVVEFTKRGKRISGMAIEFSKAMAQLQYLAMQIIEGMAKL